MKKFLMIAGAATMALSVPALGKPDNPGKGNKGNQAAKSEKGHGNHAARGAKPDKAGKPDKAERGRAERGPSDFRRDVRRTRERNEDRIIRARADRDDWDDRLRDRDDDRRDRDWRDGRDGWVEARGACPPGLAKKNNGCLPPGQAKKIFAVGERLNSNWYGDYNLPLGYRDLYSDTPNYYYRYDDNGYIYRVDRQSDLVSGLIPLLGGGFGVGQMMPAGYGVYNVPIQYRDTYYDTPDAYYRYGDNAIYQVDPQSGMIESVVALLAGGDLGIGQTLPMGYDTYNVPFQYRDQYYDTDESLYRYANGNIYQVDAKTQIIQAIISALI